MIYVSTGGNSHQTAFKTACDYSEVGIANCELSGGLYDPEVATNVQFLVRDCNVQLHNYFPPPQEPFVLNLASFDRYTLERTKKHIQSAIELTAEIGAYIYSFHAGFLLDPKVEDLGRRIEKRSLNSRNKAMNQFVDNVNNLALYAEKLGVTLLIENNVLSHMNHEYFGGNPFLMVDEKECEFVMKETAKNVSLLVDVAHLKVSATSLGFEKVDFLKVLDPWIYAYHLSDNDGLSDKNEPVLEDSWFWPHIRTDLDYYSLEVYGKSPQELAEQVKLTEKLLNIDRSVFD
jgi:sugar phosphate isomerase/epimerase